MSYRQLVTPNPSVPCRPGWCLKYVADAYGGNFPQVYPSATAAWNAAQFKHQDQNFPTNIDVPVWFSVRGVPEGHVAIRMADGSVYSTTSSTATKAVRHPNMQDLINAYAPYNPLTYLGWTEDLAGKQLVVNEGGEMSTVGETEIKYLYPSMQGYQPNDNDIASWNGTESNTFIRALHDNSRYAQYQSEVAEAFRKAKLYDESQNGGSNTEYPNWFKEFWIKMIDAIKNILGGKK